MIEAVGSKARPGSEVLIVNELSMTSVCDAAVRAAPPTAATTAAAATAAASDAISAARLLRSLLTAVLLCRGTVVFFGRTTLLDVDAGDKSGALGRGGRARARGLQPARRRAAARQRHERRLLDAAARERVRAAGVEAASARWPAGVGNLAGERLGEEAAPVRVRDRVDQRLAVRVERLLPEPLRRPGLDHPAEVHHRDRVG